MQYKKYIYSFFSGAGFLDLGFECNGYNICFVNEIYRPFLKAYTYSRKQMGLEKPEHGYSNEDIRKYLLGQKLYSLKNQIKRNQRNGYVGFIGGPPCPDFSIGGKNRGRLGENGKLSEIYIELISKCKPDFFLFENVMGLWRTKKHRQFFDEIKTKTHKAGYTTTERLINSIEYGAPQDRNRIILLGFNNRILDNKKKKIVKSSLSDGTFPWDEEKAYDKNTVFNLNWPSISPFKEDSSLPLPEGIDLRLTVEHWFEKNSVDNHPNSEKCFQPRNGLKRFLEIPEGDDSRKSFKRLHRWRYSPTACYGNNEVHLHPYKARRLNVAEALAIQSLPREYVLPDDMTLTDMFKTVGNGVPYLAAKGLAKAINNFLEDHK